MKFRTILAPGLLIVAACSSTPRGVPFSLTPRDPRPIAAITVGDANEVSLLVQELSLEPVRTEGNRLYFVADPRATQHLRDLGYVPESADIMQVERRTVRVYRKGEESELLRNGVTLINREADHWVVTGSLRQLASLRALGYRITALGPNEPRPREVRVRLPAGQSPLVLGRFELDIYSVYSAAAGVEVTAGAFDAQIDALRAAGYTVDRISTVPPGGN
jgi:hypothetical protein